MGIIGARGHNRDVTSGCATAFGRVDRQSVTRFPTLFNSNVDVQFKHVCIAQRRYCFFFLCFFLAFALSESHVRLPTDRHQTPRQLPKIQPRLGLWVHTEEQESQIMV